MAMTALSVEHMRAIGAAVREIIEAAPAQSAPNSQRRSEADRVRSTAGGGGRQRAAVLDRCSIEAATATAQATLMFEGMIDIFHVAHHSRDGRVNTAPASVIVRSVLETAGQVHWLLGTGIDGTQRAQRYFAWRFEDLKQLRRLLATPVDQPDWQLAVDEADAEEAKLIASAGLAGLAAAPQRVHGPDHIEPAKLLDEHGRPIKHPGYSELVTALTGDDGTYRLLSLVAHGQRYGTIAAIETDLATGEARMTGSPIEPGVVAGWACEGVLLAAAAIGRWNGLDLTRIQRLGAPLASSSNPQGNKTI